MLVSFLWLATQIRVLRPSILLFSFRPFSPDSSSRLHPPPLPSFILHIVIHTRPDSRDPCLIPCFLLLLSTLLTDSFSSLDSSDHLPSPPLLRLLWGFLCPRQRPHTLSLPFPFLPLSEMSPCRRDVQPLKRTALRGVRFHTTHRHGMLWQPSTFVFLRADVFRKMRTGTSQKTRRCDDEIGKFGGVSDGKTNLKVGIVC